MASKISICNQALSEVGSDPITSFDDGTVASESCKTHYDSVLKELLEKRYWSFAMKRDNLVASTEIPKYGYSNSYPIPSDCIRIKGIESSDNRTYTGWVNEAGRIFTNFDDVNINYVSGTVPTEYFTGSFESALVYLLASRLAIPIAKSRELRNELMSIAEVKIREACAEDGANTPPTQIMEHSSKLVNARRRS
ncbi:MAG: tail tube protein [Podoviridae sp. ctpVR23]|nr:MAG: tail tube protein [Podoviridae sp. ctpVR23]